MSASAPPVQRAGLNAQFPELPRGTRRQVLVCQGTGCVSAGGRRITDALRNEIQANGPEDGADVKITGCHGFCQQGPIVVIEPDGVFYRNVKPEDAPAINDTHLTNKGFVTKLLYRDPVRKERIPFIRDIDFYRLQTRLILRNCGRIDPEEIEDYESTGGYQALAKTLATRSAEEVLEEVRKSGLRGRGGAGFPAAKKWQTCRDEPGDEKYLICNADEGDPGAFMDRSVLEGDPHTVLEGLVLAGYAIGAHQGIIYCRAEYPLALARVRTAISQARDKGYLGRKICGSAFDFDVRVFEGAGAFVCGEETALIRSIEGYRGMPRSRPPFPAQEGFRDKPTIINNVKTLASLPVIFDRGAEWFAALGSPNSPGTAVFALTGKIANSGLVEVPTGTTLGRIIYDIGGATPRKKGFKAVQTGGPSGGCLPARLIDLPVDFDSLRKAGSMMGSGGLVVMDEDTCMVDVARFFLTFTMSESCGKCVPCRVGITHLVKILEKIVEGNGSEDDIDRLEHLAKIVAGGSLCGLGQTAPNPVVSALRYFRPEFESHVRDKRCPAVVCKALVSYRIIGEKCVGCQKCVEVCPTGAITGPRKHPHTLDRSKCIKCHSCYEVCRFDAVAGDAIVVESGGRRYVTA